MIKKIWFIVIGLLLMACLCSPLSAITVTPAPPTQAASTVTPISPTPQTVLELNPAGPWLLVTTTDGLWVANPDGTGMARVAGITNWDTDLSRAVQPEGNQVVLLTFGADPYHNLALQLLSLPDGKLQKVTDLTTAASEPAPDATPGDPTIEAARAIVEQSSYAWSPDGKRLAFTAALDGPQADIYVFDTQNKTITRISQDNGQDYSPSWSPDGNTILYCEAEVFGTGAGIAIQGVWSASSDGANVTLLYQPDSSGEELLGWRDNRTVVLDSWSPSYGTTQLRLFNIITKSQTVLQAGLVAGAAVATGIPDDLGTVLFSQSDGLYLLPPGSDQPAKLSDFPLSDSNVGVLSIRWLPLPEGRMFVVQFGDGSLTTFQADGSQRQEAPFNPVSGSADVSMYGYIWGWTNRGNGSEGAWITGPGLEIMQLLQGPASAPVWTMDNNLLFFVGTDLYRATFDNYYTDTAQVASLSGDVTDAILVGWSSALP